MHSRHEPDYAKRLPHCVCADVLHNRNLAYVHFLFSKRNLQFYISNQI